MTRLDRFRVLFEYKLPFQEESNLVCLLSQFKRFSTHIKCEQKVLFLILHKPTLVVKKLFIQICSFFR
jgi:hypothetical protein